jgi:hypothetical protein
MHIGKHQLHQPAESNFCSKYFEIHQDLNYILELMFGVLGLSTNRVRFCWTHLVRMPYMFYRTGIQR